ncbi:MAG TPA: response regulator [Myxococcota bacterium]|nr:response regulator [Myxococcota bacterium]
MARMDSVGSEREYENPRGTVLLVDDNTDVLEIAQEMLERLGFDVHAASQGRDALEWLRSHTGPVAAALVDLAMPEMSGGDVARELQRIRPSTPILIMSGFREEIARGRLPGDLRIIFLRKPFTREQLAQTLRDLGPTL